MKAKKILLFLFGFLVLLIALWKVDFINGISQVKNIINWKYIILCAILINSVIIFRAIRWKYMISMLKISKISFWQSMKIVGPSFFIASITPSRIGEISKVLLTKDKKKTLAAFGVEYLGDFLAVLLVPAFFLMIYLQDVKYFLIIFSSIILALTVMFFLLKNAFIDRIFLLIFPNKKMIIKHKKELTAIFTSYIKNKKVVLWSLTIGILNYLIFYLIGYVVIISLGINIDILTVITGLSIAQIIGIITFIPLGIGTREVSALGFFMLNGLNSSMTMNALIILRLLAFLPILFGYLLYLIRIKD